MHVLGSSLTYDPHINHSGEDSLTKISLGAPIFWSGREARSNKNSNTTPVSTVCRLQTGWKMPTRYKMQTENLCCFFVWYVITCHLTTYRVSRKRFSAIIFHNYLRYCGIFLVRFLITIVLNIISSPNIVWLRANWLAWCLYRIYQLSKSRWRCKWDATIEYLTCAIFEKIHLLNRYVIILLTKMRTWYNFNVQRCTHTDFHICVLHCYWFTFLVVLFFVGSVTTEILIYEKQIIQRLEILLRTIVTALFKTKDIEKRARNI